MLDVLDLALEVRHGSITRLGLVALRRAVRAPPKDVEALARREVEVEEVDVVAPEALDGRARRRFELLGAEVVGLAVEADARRVALRRDIKILALDRASRNPRREPVADPGLRHLAVVEGYRVKLGRVEEVDARLHERVELLVRRRFLLDEAAPGHRAGADLGHVHRADLLLDERDAALERPGRGLYDWGLRRETHRGAKGYRGAPYSHRRHSSVQRRQHSSVHRWPAFCPVVFFSSSKLEE